MSKLQERAALAQSEISSFRKQIDKECVDKLELKHKVQKLEYLEHREKDVKKPRVDASHQ